MGDKLRNVPVAVSVNQFTRMRSKYTRVNNDQVAARALRATPLSALHQVWAEGRDVGSSPSWAGLGEGERDL